MDFAYAAVANGEDSDIADNGQSKSGIIGVRQSDPTARLRIAQATRNINQSAAVLRHVK
jgi:hypothetical protein